MTVWHSVFSPYRFLSPLPQRSPLFVLAFMPRFRITPSSFSACPGYPGCIGCILFPPRFWMFCFLGVLFFFGLGCFALGVTPLSRLGPSFIFFLPSTAFPLVYSPFCGHFLHSPQTVYKTKPTSNTFPSDCCKNKQ